MDFDNAWTTCREETSPTAWKKKAQYPPSCYSSIQALGSPYSNAENDNSLCISGNDTPYSNVHYCPSPEFSNTNPYAPEMCIPSELNGNMGYPSYFPRMTPTRYRESVGHNNFHLLCNDPRLKVGIDAKNYYSQLSQHQQHMKMYSQAYMRNYDSNMSGMKQNVKKTRKKRNNKQKNKNTRTLNTSLMTNEASILRQSVSDTNSLQLGHESVSDYIHLNASPTLNKIATKMNAFPKEKRFVNEPYPLPQIDAGIGESRTDFQNRCNPSNITSNSTFKTSDVSLTSKETIISVPNKQPNILSDLNDDTKANSSTGSNIIFPNNNNINEQTNNLTTINDSDLSDAPVEEIPLEESKNQFYNIQTSTLENSNEKSENVIYQSIFEGKDENGQDVIILFAAPGGQQEIPQENIFQTYAESTELKSNEMAANSTEIIILSDQNSVQMNFSGVPQITKGDENNSQFNKNMASQNNCTLDQKNENVIISGVNDCFLEEIVDFSENNCSNSKRMKKQEIPLANSTVVKKNRNKRKQCAEANFSDEINASKNTELQATFSSSKQLSDSIAMPCRFPKNYKKRIAKFKTKKLKWKKHFQWKTNTQLDGLQSMYFAKIMKRLRRRYKNIKHKAVWKIMEIILDRIGGSVLRSIHSTMQLLVKNYVEKNDT